MDKSPPVVWAKHLVKAAIEYYCERKTRCGILVDNDILKDGMLTSINATRNDFIICIAPGYVTQMEYSSTEMNITVKFGDKWHVMSIPYGAICMVLTIDEKHTLTEDGHVNMISIPPVIYPTNSNHARRKKETMRVTNDRFVHEIVGQPAQEDLMGEVNVRLFNRRRSDTGAG
ncbi:hypothetical protein D3C86_1173490 [compost metagenome]